MNTATILTLGNIALSIVAGLLAGGYLAVFHPTLPGWNLIRRGALQAWYFGFLGSILYGARIAFAAANARAEGTSDLGRAVGGWLLWLIFSIAIGVGSYLVGIFRLRRS